jgi:hypothetical protein
MPRGHRKIEEAQRLAIVEKSNAGESLRDLVDWLREQHGIEVSRQAVHEIITRARGADPSTPTAPRGSLNEEELTKTFDRRLRSAIRICARASREAFARDDGIDRFAKAYGVYLKMHLIAKRNQLLSEPSARPFDGLYGFLALARAERAAAEDAFVREAHQERQAHELAEPPDLDEADAG